MGSEFLLHDVDDFLVTPIDFIFFYSTCYFSSLPLQPFPIIFLDFLSFPIFIIFFPLYTFMYTSSVVFLMDVCEKYSYNTIIH